MLPTAESQLLHARGMLRTRQGVLYVVCGYLSAFRAALCSYGETTLTAERWESMKQLEAARIERLPAMQASPPAAAAASAVAVAAAAAAAAAAP